MNKHQPVLVIVGPTASGKTSLALEIAERWGGEIISADSRQVYRGLDIGTEKIQREDMRGIPHYCLDLASPSRNYTVELWRAHAEKALKAIWKKGKLPIVVGGTGLYVDALMYGTRFPEVKPNLALRRTLSKKSPGVLFEELSRIDPARAETIERNNPRRLIRAIEIALALGRVPELEPRKERYPAHWIGLSPQFDELERRISARLEHALARGLIEETRRLRDEQKLSWERLDELGLEYRAVAAYLRGEIPQELLREMLFIELRRYAKRQLRWWRDRANITWYESGDEALSALTVRLPR